MKFTSNDRPTLGVEIELQLVDADSMDLKSAIHPILDKLDEDDRLCVKPELMQCYLEINTGVCDDVAAVRRDLSGRIATVAAAAEATGTRLLWAATHPFADWTAQKVTPDERYEWLVENLQDTARRLVTFGLHVHVGVDTGDKAIMICDRILRHLPTLLALSSSSPFWIGRNTGLKSQRSKVMENLPTAGLPPLMRNWSEYLWLVNHLIDTGFIRSMREIWWDVRPHHNFGTVEVRICDMPGCLDDVVGITALVQCLVQALSNQIDDGAYQYDCHPMMVRQNKWRAARYGMEAELVHPHTQNLRPARTVVGDLVNQLRTTAQDLGCEDELLHVREMTRTGADRQLELYAQSGNLRKVVRTLTETGVPATV